jgi:hypothetical protein
LDLGFVPPFGDSRKYNQIKALSIYGIVFSISNLEKDEPFDSISIPPG